MRLDSCSCFHLPVRRRTREFENTSSIFRRRFREGEEDPQEEYFPAGLRGAEGWRIDDARIEEHDRRRKKTVHRNVTLNFSFTRFFHIFSRS